MKVFFDVRIMNNYVQMGVSVAGSSYEWFNLMKASKTSTLPDQCIRLLNPSKYFVNASLCIRSYKQTVGVTGISASGTLKLRYCLWNNSLCYMSSGWSFKI